jgi:hypothetical protein
MRTPVKQTTPGGMVVLNSGRVSNEGSTVGQAVESPMKDREASHRSSTFQPLFQQVLELCENGNEEIAYRMLWSGKAYSPEEAAEARAAKERYAQVA